MTFLPLAQADLMEFDDIEAFLEGHSANDDDRLTVWKTILQPFFRDVRTQRKPKFVTAKAVLVPYGSNPSAPISDIGNAVGYIICTAALEQRGNRLSTPIIEWAMDLAASYAVLLLTLCRNFAQGATPTVIHILWTKSQNIELHSELPAAALAPDIHQAMGSSLPGFGPIVKKDARKLRARALETALSSVGFPEVAEFVRTFMGHPEMGSCAEVLPFLSIISAVPPRPGNRTPVSGFALNTTKIQELASPRTAMDIHRHGFVDACDTCRGLMASISVNYIEIRPGDVPSLVATTESEVAPQLQASIPVLSTTQVQITEVILQSVDTHPRPESSGDD